VIFSSGSAVTGLDIGTTSVKAATLKHTSKGARLTGLALAEIAQSDDWAQSAAEAAVAALAESGTAKNTPVVSAVGGTGVSVKHVTFPEMPKQALAESIRWEARKHVPFEGADFVLDFQPLEGANGDDNGELQVLLAAVETRLLDSHIELLGAAGVEPDTVDLTPLVLMNEMDEEGLLDDEALCVIDVGVQGITMVVYRRKGLFFARSIPLVGKKAPKTPDEKSGDGGGDSAGDDAWLKVLEREVRRSLTFYNNETGKKGIGRIYLTGGRALTPGIDKRLQSDLRIPTEVLNPLANLTDVGVDLEALKPEGPRFAVALGLARRQ